MKTDVRATDIQLGTARIQTKFKVMRLNEIITSEFKQRKGLGIKFWGTPKSRGQGEEAQSEKETKGKASEAGEKTETEQRPGRR